MVQYLKKKKITKRNLNIESQYLQNRNTHRIAIHIESPPKYRDRIGRSLPIPVPTINAAKSLILIMFSFTLDIYCTSVRPGRGIPHMWLSLRFLLSFYLLKGFLVVFPYSC